MWIYPQTMQVFKLHSDIRSAFPEVSFPSTMSDNDIAFVGVLSVTPVTPPEHNPITQELRELVPVATQSGHYEQRWEVVSRYATPEEESAAVLANLLDLKAAKNAEINAARLAANFSTFTHAGKQIACDQLSRSDIDGTNGFVTLYGMLPPGWPGGWKAVDNTYVPIATVNDWKAFYASMFAAGNANFAKAQTLKAQLDATTTAEEVAVITW